jgi:hypothetical protein
MSTTIERVRLFAAVVLVAIGGVLSTAALAGEDPKAPKPCTGYCRDDSISCGPLSRRMACCCKEDLQHTSLRWECYCLYITDCGKYRESGLCQGI